MSFHTGLNNRDPTVQYALVLPSPLHQQLLLFLAQTPPQLERYNVEVREVASQASGGKGDSTDDCSRLGESRVIQAPVLDTGHGTRDTGHSTPDTGTTHY